MREGYKPQKNSLKAQKVFEDDIREAMHKFICTFSLSSTNDFEDLAYLGEISLAKTFAAHFMTMLDLSHMKEDPNFNLEEMIEEHVNIIVDMILEMNENREGENDEED